MPTACSLLRHCQNRRLRFLSSGRVHFMSRSTYLVVNYLTQAVYNPEWFVIRKSVPGTKRQIFTESVLFRGIEILLRNTNCRHLIKRRLRLLPLGHGVFDIHTVGCSGLHQELHTGIAPLQRVSECTAQEIMPWLVRHRIG